MDDHHPSLRVVEFSHHPSRRELRLFACTGLPLLCGILGALGYWTFDAPLVGSLIWIIGAAFSVIGLLHPPALTPILRGLMYATFPIRWTVFYLSMVALYYLIVTPIGLVLRALRPSSMRTFRDPRESSCWQARPPAAADAEQYYRQH